MKIEYRNLYIHYVLTCFGRQKLIPEKNRVRIEKYITGIVTNSKSKLYAIFVNPDHTHILISRTPDISDQDLITTIADSTEFFINENKLSNAPFKWQQSASAFSVSKSDVDKVCKYILNQKEHHKKLTFAEEYEIFLKHYQNTIDKKEDTNSK